jgi:hypothetical protein
MKNKKFADLFLLVAWIIFFGSGRNLWGSLLLMIAGIYMLVEVIPDIVKRREDNAERKS